MNAKAIIEALDNRPVKEENKTLSKRLAENKTMATLLLKTEALVDTVVYGVKEVNVQTL